VSLPEPPLDEYEQAVQIVLEKATPLALMNFFWCAYWRVDLRTWSNQILKAKQELLIEEMGR
jgi:hypothetical protein